MATERFNDLKAFKGFIDEKLSSESDELTLAEALTHWEIENQGAEERKETLEAIQEGFADIEAGRLTPVRAALDELRKKYGLPPLP
ncbi:hypothetical protein [Paludisphaera mucosa]|uniref:Uncharacterized protein n=1 Tax=Paludisphaera mucosa TaxID=3030827 RepID=A0ABT6FJR5_9BACT|nr:hypothetical protein [Paludisphaera mucosa]MDG3007823.1 hypothetical protein [Paludisphaera mucosa]